MFSLQIVDTDAFLDMPISSQVLYFHLVMRADDEGFVSNPKKIMRLVGTGDDDMKILIGKRFLLSFESGVVVIKHWLIHNTIRMDRFNKTSYQKEKNTLLVSENKAYTELATIRQPKDNQLVTQVKLSKVKLSEDKLIKDNNTAETSSALISSLIESFVNINPACKNMYGNKTQRKACDDLITSYGFEEVNGCIINVLPRTNGQSYFPTITTPVQLRDKWMSLKSAVAKKRGKTIEIIN